MSKINIHSSIAAPIDKVWSYWTSPEHIVNWNYASDDWHTPHATNDLRIGGKFLSRMEAKDGSFGFDFEGTYNAIEPHKLIDYDMTDGRNAVITFVAESNKTDIFITFDAENVNPIEMQKDGWQAILDNFKKYVEEK